MFLANFFFKSEAYSELVPKSGSGRRRPNCNRNKSCDRGPFYQSTDSKPHKSLENSIKIIAQVTKVR